MQKDFKKLAKAARHCAKNRAHHSLEKKFRKDCFDLAKFKDTNLKDKLKNDGPLNKHLDSQLGTEELNFCFEWAKSVAAVLKQLPEGEADKELIKLLKQNALVADAKAQNPVGPIAG